ncbi:MAG TPA: inositol monophosphatase family protein [Candidatus Sumerlaeota bacterium]|nr:MAG: Histidinol-phosphatase [candidate division BRC1 bacterium ADurb.BinA292]HOE96827.1 inositol monophosphatase family protein [Candidatus Sumerlaeota bacterium]HOR28288.1 inositol monophosphatase family protein [Candidatus Sumerlaeota bacterium]HPK03333.1 inositol monophosphatase family protein [Candidatus Sumerlaeota bacterium]
MSPKPKRDEIDTYLKFAVQLAHEAGRITLRYYRQGVAVDLKADESPVTIADRDTEAFMRERIMEQFPDHGIIGEEHGRHNPDARWQWILDPIDGTQSFIRGIPLYTVLLALECSGESHLGVIHCPAQDETVAAATGKGCTYNGEPCRVRATARLEEAWVNVTNVADLARRRPRFTEALLRRAQSVRTWADAYSYLQVAAGRTDIAIDPVMNLWDIAPIKPIIQEAGGRFSDFNGNSSIHTTNALVSTGPLHDELLALARLDEGDAQDPG